MGSKPQKIRARGCCFCAENWAVDEVVDCLLIELLCEREFRRELVWMGEAVSGGGEVLKAV